MAKASKSTSGQKKVISEQHLRTSIGQSVNTRPKNKSKKRDFKPYKGQGK
jgi:hypothetical protein|tara:strand:+ start:4073 stop:4222 length:150 start_codon:yes stop_codon:yes gene_type:complete